MPSYFPSVSIIRSHLDLHGGTMPPCSDASFRSIPVMVQDTHSTEVPHFTYMSLEDDHMGVYNNNWFKIFSVRLLERERNTYVTSNIQPTLLRC